MPDRTTPAPLPPPIDWKKLLVMTNYTPDIAKELLDSFAIEIPELRAAVNNAYKQSDFKNMQDQLHKLRGCCCYIGAPRLTLIAEKLEELLRSNNHFVIREMLAELNLEIDRVVTAIREQSYVNK